MMGEAIKRAREDSKLSKAELARRLRVSWVTVWKWERGLTVPQSRRLLELIRILPSFKNYLDGEGDGKKRAKR